ncbi:MAG: serine protease [Desulfobacter sp.]|nr:MAG: serine protease [Desulfobacter sp.]
MKSHIFHSKTLLFSLMFLCSTLVFATLNAGAASGYSALASKIRPGVVTILVYDYTGQLKSVGSGFFYNDQGDILTNSHVLLKNHRAEIKTMSGKKYAVGAIISRDEKGDIVKAKTHVPKTTPFLKPASKPPVSGENIMVVGSPMGLEQTVSEGIVSAWRKIKGIGKVIQISAPISPGSSGGPVLNMNGDVVGVATFQLVQGQNLNFAMPIKDFFEKENRQSRPKTKKLSIRKSKTGVIIIE